MKEKEEKKVRERKTNGEEEQGEEERRNSLFSSLSKKTRTQDDDARGAVADFFVLRPRELDDRLLCFLRERGEFLGKRRKR